MYLEELPPEQAGAAYDLQDMALLFFKWFEPGTSTLTYFTHMVRACHHPRSVYHAALQPCPLAAARRACRSLPAGAPLAAPYLLQSRL